MITVKKLKTLINKIKETDFDELVNSDELKKYKDKIIEKFGIEGGVDASKFDDMFIELCKKLKLIEVYSFGKKKLIKLSKWFQNIIDKLEESEIDDMIKNIISKFRI